MVESPADLSTMTQPTCTAEQPNQFSACVDVPDASVNSLRLFLAAGTKWRHARLFLPPRAAGDENGIYNIIIAIITLACRIAV